jgi:two-component system response regulator YesN
MNLLISTDKKSYEIANEVGFSDVKYFSELFQKVYEISPSSYRKELRKRGE